MLPFAHVGITLGLAGITAVVQSKSHFFSHSTSTSSASSAPQATSNPREKSWLFYLAQYGDLRFLILGSLLPDIVDKPIGLLLFGNGRIFCHSLFFLLLVSAGGAYLWRVYHKTWLILISAGTFTHLILDQMWFWPRTFFWPLKGWAFPIGIRGAWLAKILDILLTTPAINLLEIVGLIIILTFCLLLINQKKLGEFIRYGRI